MKAYLGDTKLKDKFIKEIKWHEEQDKIIQGTYGKGSNGDWKGCAVGCSIHSLNRINKQDFRTDDHKVFETELGIPSALAYLEDRIFEGLTAEDSKKWPLRFSEAIKPGADLSNITSHFIVWLLDTKNDTYKNAFPDGKKAITKVRNLYKKQLSGKVITEEEWSAARSAARSAAWSAAWSAESAESAARSAAWSAAWSAESAESAARSAARSAAWSAAWSAESAAESAESAESAARSAAESAARSAAWSAAFTQMADKLIELLGQAK